MHITKNIAIIVMITPTFLTSMQLPQNTSQNSEKNSSQFSGPFSSVNSGYRLPWCELTSSTIFSPPSMQPQILSRLTALQAAIEIMQKNTAENTQLVLQRIETLTKKVEDLSSEVKKNDSSDSALSSSSHASAQANQQLVRRNSSHWHKSKKESRNTQ